jgi:hypothetical protein
MGDANIYCGRQYWYALDLGIAIPLAHAEITLNRREIVFPKRLPKGFSLAPDRLIPLRQVSPDRHPILAHLGQFHWYRLLFLASCSIAAVNPTIFDSAGLGALIEMHRKTKTKCGSLKLCNLGPNLRQASEIARLLPIFETCPTETAAVASF